MKSARVRKKIEDIHGYDKFPKVSGFAEIPPLTLSGGMLSDFGGKKEVLEYRLWLHNRDGRLSLNEGCYFTQGNLKELLMMRKELLKDKKIFKVEQPLAVVWDYKCKGYREVKIDGIDYSQEGGP